MPNLPGAAECYVITEKLVSYKSSLIRTGKKVHETHNQLKKISFCPTIAEQDVKSVQPKTKRLVYANLITQRSPKAPSCFIP